MSGDNTSISTGFFVGISDFHKVHLQVYKMKFFEKLNSLDGSNGQISLYVYITEFENSLDDYFITNIVGTSLRIGISGDLVFNRKT